MSPIRRLLFFATLILLVAGSAFAQSATTGSLTGSVVMDKGPLPGVTVTATSPSLQGTRVTTTDVNGAYNIGLLPPGMYNVRFEMEGMAAQNVEAKVGVGQIARADATMRLTAVAEAITVTAGATAAVETQQVQANYQQQLVQELPVTRTLLSTTALAPGVNANGPRGAQTISGAYSYDNLYMVNGVSVGENIRGQPHDLFIEDAIQETTVFSGGAISAEFGRFTGGVVNAITKSGGNDFSGSVRDTLNNDKWTAKSAAPFTLDAQGQATPVAVADPTDKVNNTYEGTFGGRVVRDRLWFFLAGRDQKQDQSRTFARSSQTYSRSLTNKRVEGKLTGQITPAHTLVVSYLNNDSKSTNDCQLTAGCLDPSGLDPSTANPNKFYTAHYSGVFGANFLVEAQYAKKKFAFVGFGGDNPDFIQGTLMRDFGEVGNGEGFNAPEFSGINPENRDSNEYLLKGSYYLGTKSFGTHNLVAGINNYGEQRRSDNHQSASDYAYWLTNYSPVRDANGNVTSVHIAQDDFLVYFPVLQPSQGSNFKTFSTFFNDKWDLNPHWSVNLGARYDKLNAIDASKVKVANDSLISPRLGATYDVQGNGRFRINASFSRYVSRLSESIESNTTVAGTPAVLAYFYGGPEFTGTPHDALAVVQQWFQSLGGPAGLTDPTIRFVNNVPGGTLRLANGSLSSPHVDEWSIGFGSQISRNGYIRADYLNRKWGDFYTSVTDTTTGRVIDANGAPADLTLITNGNSVSRTYHAVELQGQYRLFQRIDVGGSYTWSKLRGNTEGETGGAGPVTDASVTTYPEFKTFAQYNPTGYLSADQRHRLRAWAAMDFPTPLGKFNVSLLQRFDSGTPYSLAGTAVISPYTAAIRSQTKYVSPPTTTTYYFSDRGQFRWDDVSSTDVALNYEIPISTVRLFAQAQVINVFNHQAQVGGDTSVLTNAQVNCIQSNGTARCARFNPFTGDVPQQGVNYQLGPLFGRPTTAATPANVNEGTASFQLPRTYRFSLGVRF